MPPASSGASGWAVADAADEAPRLSEYRDILLDHKWLIAGLALLSLLAGLAFATLATPVYRARLLVQIEDALPESKHPLAEAAGVFEVRTPANGEIQVLASHMVLDAAVAQTGLQVDARPRYLPGVGPWLARRATGLSTPGFAGLPGYVTGTERIAVAHVEVPPVFEDSTPFVVTAQGGGRYTLAHELLEAPLAGRVGEPLRQALPGGMLSLELRVLEGEPGAQFSVAVASRFRAVERLQERLQLGEQGRQSNVIGVSLEDSDRERLARVLNAIGEQYVRQNMERRSAEAEKTLAFLDAQLPVFLRQLQASEDAFARFRNKHGTVDFDEEAKVWLKRTSDLQASLLELQQRRREADANFAEASPRIRILASQINAVQGELNALNARIVGMPNLERDALRLERDVRVNATLYQSMQNNALQMRLLKEGKVGNVRLLDKAIVSKVPVKPRKSLIVAFALLLGLLLGPALAIAHARTRPGIHNAAEAEGATGLEVYAVVPHSPEQVRLQRSAGKGAAARLLADAHPRSAAVEALRTLRVGLKPALAQARNNRLLITGPTPGIGKSFVSGNFAALLAQSGKRVLLVNADLRKDEPELFDLPRAGGLAELVAGALTAEQAIHAGVRPRLDVLTTGALPELPTDLLESEAFAATLDALSARYDLVLIDSAPVLVAADAAAVAPACGTVLLVARAGRSQEAELKESIRRLHQAGAWVGGVLLNGLDLRRRYTGSGSYRQAAYRPGGYTYAG